MKVLVVLLFAILPLASATSEPMNCHIGPVTRELGGGKWQVTSCSDGRSLVFATMEGNPAMPFIFFVSRSGEQTQIHGEGNGSKEHTSAAFEALKALSDSQLDELVQTTIKAESAK